jgi:hypothetical protein
MKQLPLDTSLFPNPVSLIHDDPSATRPTGPGRPPRKKRPAKGAAGQTFLPGLSRRGRPRAEQAASPTERASASRERRLQDGAKRLELFLEPAAAADLDALLLHFRVSRTELIARLLAREARRISRRQPR